jgi:hypothetical protein
MKVLKKGMLGACLGGEKERWWLASVKIGVLSKSTVLEPMRYDARALMKEAKEE